MSEEETKEIVLFSNTSLVRKADGSLSVYVDGVQLIGATGIQVTANNVLVLAVPMDRVRLAEQEPKPVQYEKRDNVIEFKNLRKYQDVTPPQTDGDSA